MANWHIEDICNKYVKSQKTIRSLALKTLHVNGRFKLNCDYLVYDELYKHNVYVFDSYLNQPQYRKG